MIFGGSRGRIGLGLRTPSIAPGLRASGPARAPGRSDRRRHLRRRVPCRWKVRRQSSEVEKSAVRFLLPDMFDIASVSCGPVRGFNGFAYQPRARSIAAAPALFGLPGGSKRGRPLNPRGCSMDPVTRKFLDNIRVHGFRIGYIQFALGNRAVVFLARPRP